jgi:DNA-binding HxlR family transcriptional regulator
MDVLSRPWSGLLIATLEEGPLRFTELSERVQGIGDRMLSLRLKELEAQGVLVRTAVVGPPSRVEYALTPAGHGFRPVMAAVASWGAALRAAEPGGADTALSYPSESARAVGSHSVD